MNDNMINVVDLFHQIEKVVTGLRTLGAFLNGVLTGF